MFNKTTFALLAAILLSTALPASAATKHHRVPSAVVAAVRRLVAQLAVALARDLALVHHQTAGDESFADPLSHVSCRVWLATQRDARDCGEHCEAARFLAKRLR
jgi:hypothetical protein